jgi:DNA polymerase elongation subunit (family B)
MSSLNLKLRPGLKVSPGFHPTLRFQVLSVEVYEKSPPSVDISDVDVLRQDSTYLEPDDGGMMETCAERCSRACEVCVFGVSSAGHTIVVRVNGFMPHFFVEVTDVVSVDVLNSCARQLRERFKLSYDSIRLEFVRRKRMYGWVPDASDPRKVAEFTFGRFSFVNPYLMRTAARLFDDGGLSCLRNLNEKPKVSEGRVAVSEKFLAAHGLKASGWVTLDDYVVISSSCRATVSQLEVRCVSGKLEALERESIAPLVIAAVDIEAHSHDYRSFPDASHPDDACTFIGTTFWVYGEDSPRERIMQVLGETEAAPEAENVRVLCYETEYDLLVGWRDLMAIDGNPDMVVSYNGTGFDYAYLAKRVNVVRGKRRACRFNFLGRMLLTPNPLSTRELTSAAKGQNVLSWFPQPGRVQMDLFMYVKDSQKLSSYKLDDVCGKFLPTARKVVLDHPGWVRRTLVQATKVLGEVARRWDGDWSGAAALLEEAASKCPESGGGEEKAYMDVNERVNRAVGLCVGKVPEDSMDEVRSLLDREVQPCLDASGDNNYRKLFRLYDESPSARTAIALYCQVDCDLVVMLLDRLNVVANTIQMSQVCNTLPDDVCNRGQQIKTYNLISRFASARNYVLNVRETGWDPNATYEGATVLEPVPGYYQVPVATLDFASLYPSLMRGYNLCHSSLVLDKEYENVPGVKYSRYDIAGRTWTFQESTPGVLPEILTSLLEARRAKKREMKQYPKGSFEHRLCDGAQLALKVSCNSVYGFCGVLTNGMYPCMPVAVATTFNGRRAIEMTKSFMEEKYDATVVYGDTDSVMVTFPNVTTVEEAFPLAERAGEEATAIFPDAVVLEFEKVFFPYLLVKKKTYAGMKYEDDPSAPPNLDVKGLAVVRRDNCELVRDVMGKILHLTMQDRNPMAAYAAVENAVNDLIQGKVPISKLQISNSLKNIESYTNTAQPQLTVVRKMKERRAFDVPRSGDRVPYVIMHDPKLPKVSDRAEHPAYVEDHPELKLDLEYYLVNQLQKRLEVIVKPLPVPDIDKLFSDAVARFRDSKVDQNMLMNLCRTVKREGSSLKGLAPREVKRKKGGWDKSDHGVAPLVSRKKTCPAQRLKKRGRGWKVEEEVTSSLLSLIPKK